MKYTTLKKQEFKLVLLPYIELKNKNWLLDLL